MEEGKDFFFTVRHLCLLTSTRYNNLVSYICRVHKTNGNWGEVNYKENLEGNSVTCD